MEYELPNVEVAGSASELLQTYVGPRIDGNGYALSLMVSMTVDD